MRTDYITHVWEWGCVACMMLAVAVVFALPPALAAQDAESPPPLRADVQVTSEGEASFVLSYREDMGVPPELEARAREEAGDEAVVRLDEGGVELRFPDRPMVEIVPVLRVAREADGPFPVVVRIPDELRSGDVWEFQALLSQAGLRQVRIVSGGGQSPASAPDS